jgi:hypothetical protein
MKHFIHTVPLVTLFIKSFHAQNLPDSEARLIAWCAYGTFVSDLLTTGVPLKPGTDFTHPNQAAVRGGTPCPESVTNFDLFSIADGS